MSIFLNYIIQFKHKNWKSNPRVNRDPHELSVAVMLFGRFQRLPRTFLYPYPRSG